MQPSEESLEGLGRWQGGDGSTANPGVCMQYRFTLSRFVRTSSKEGVAKGGGSRAACFASYRKCDNSHIIVRAFLLCTMMSELGQCHVSLCAESQILRHDTSNDYDLSFSMLFVLGSLGSMRCAMHQAMTLWDSFW